MRLVIEIDCQNDAFAGGSATPRHAEVDPRVHRCLWGEHRASADPPCCADQAFAVSRGRMLVTPIVPEPPADQGSTSGPSCD